MVDFLVVTLTPQARLQVHQRTVENTFRLQREQVQLMGGGAQACIAIGRQVVI
jgi:hypothetical protein